MKKGTKKLIGLFIGVCLVAIISIYVIVYMMKKLASVPEKNFEKYNGWIILKKGPDALDQTYMTISKDDSMKKIRVEKYDSIYKKYIIGDTIEEKK